MRVFTHFKFIKILLLKCACVKIKTKANSGLKKNRTKGAWHHEKKKVITLIVAALAFTMTGCGQFNRNFSIGINSGKQTGYPVYDWCKSVSLCIAGFWRYCGVWECDQRSACFSGYSESQPLERYIAESYLWPFWSDWWNLSGAWRKRMGRVYHGISGSLWW